MDPLKKYYQSINILNNVSSDKGKILLALDEIERQLKLEANADRSHVKKPETSVFVNLSNVENLFHALLINLEKADNVTERLLAVFSLACKILLKKIQVQQLIKISTVCTDVMVKAISEQKWSLVEKCFNCLMHFESKEWKNVFGSKERRNIILKIIHSVINLGKESSRNKPEVVALQISCLEVFTVVFKTEPLSKDDIITPEEWFTVLLPIVFAENSELRKVARRTCVTVKNCCKGSYRLLPTWTGVKEQIKTSYSRSMLQFVLSNEIDWVDLWCLILDILGPEFAVKKNNELINNLLEVEETAFRSTNMNTRYRAFIGWKFLVKRFLDTSLEDASKRLKLLIQPLIASNSKTLDIYTIKFEVWWQLIVGIEPYIEKHATNIIYHFLNFCYGPVTETAKTVRTNSALPASVLLAYRPTLSTSPSSYPLVTIKRMKGIDVNRIDALAQILNLNISTNKMLYKLHTFQRVVISHPQTFLNLSKMLIHCVGECTIVIAESNEMDAQEKNHYLKDIWKNLLLHIRRVENSSPKEAPEKQEKVDLIKNLFRIILRLIEGSAENKQLVSVCLKPVLEIILSEENGLSDEVLTSRSYYVGTDLVTGTPLFFMLDIFLSPMCLSFVHKEEDQKQQFDVLYMVLLQRILHLGIGPVDVTIHFTQTLMRKLDVSLYNTCVEESRVNTIWIMVTKRLTSGYVGLGRDINQGTDTEPDFECLNMLLMFPIIYSKVFLRKQEVILKCWGQLFQAFQQNVFSNVCSITGNEICNSLCGKVLMELNKKKVISCDELLHLVKLITSAIEQIPFNSVNKTVIGNSGDCAKSRYLDQCCTLLETITTEIQKFDKLEKNFINILIQISKCYLVFCENLLIFPSEFFTSFIEEIPYLLSVKVVNSSTENRSFINRCQKLWKSFLNGPLYNYLRSCDILSKHRMLKLMQPVFIVSFGHLYHSIHEITINFGVMANVTVPINNACGKCRTLQEKIFRGNLSPREILNEESSTEEKHNILMDVFNRPLTSHQREMFRQRRDDVPALYQDLTQDSQQSLKDTSQEIYQVKTPEKHVDSNVQTPPDSDSNLAGGRTSFHYILKRYSLDSAGKTDTNRKMNGEKEIEISESQTNQANSSGSPQSCAASTSEISTGSACNKDDGKKCKTIIIIKRNGDNLSNSSINNGPLISSTSPELKNAANVNTLSKVNETKDDRNQIVNSREMPIRMCFSKLTTGTPEVKSIIVDFPEEQKYEQDSSEGKSQSCEDFSWKKTGKTSQFLPGHEKICDLLKQDSPTILKEHKNSPNILKRNKNSPNILKKNRNSPNILKQNKNFPTLLKEEKNSPALLKEDKKSPVLLKEDKKSPTLVTEDKKSPTLVTEDKKSPTLMKEDKKSPTLVKEDKKSPTLVKEDKKSPTLVKEDKKSPTLVKEDKKSPALVKEDKKSPALVMEDKKSPALVKEEEKSPALVKEEKKSPALVKEDKKSPALVKEDKKSPALVKEDKKSPALVKEDKKSPALVKEEEKSPALVKEDKKSPALVKEDKKSPALVKEEKKSPALVKEEKKSPTLIKQDKTSPILMKQSKTSSTLMKQGKNSSTLIKQDENSDTVLNQEKNSESQNSYESPKGLKKSPKLATKQISPKEKCSQSVDQLSTKKNEVEIYVPTSNGSLVVSPSRVIVKRLEMKDVSDAKCKTWLFDKPDINQNEGESTKQNLIADKDLKNVKCEFSSSGKVCVEASLESSDSTIASKDLILDKSEHGESSKLLKKKKKNTNSVPEKNVQPIDMTPVKSDIIEPKQSINSKFKTYESSDLSDISVLKSPAITQINEMKSESQTPSHEELSETPMKERHEHDYYKPVKNLFEFTAVSPQKVSKLGNDANNKNSSDECDERVKIVRTYQRSRAKSDSPTSIASVSDKGRNASPDTNVRHKIDDGKSLDSAETCERKSYKVSERKKHKNKLKENASDSISHDVLLEEPRQTRSKSPKTVANKRAKFSSNRTPKPVLKERKLKEKSRKSLSVVPDTVDSLQLENSECHEDIHHTRSKNQKGILQYLLPPEKKVSSTMVSKQTSSPSKLKNETFISKNCLETKKNECVEHNEEKQEVHNVDCYTENKLVTNISPLKENKTDSPETYQEQTTIDKNLSTNEESPSEINCDKGEYVRQLSLMPQTESITSSPQVYRISTRSDWARRFGTKLQVETARSLEDSDSEKDNYSMPVSDKNTTDTFHQENDPSSKAIASTGSEELGDIIDSSQDPKETSGRSVVKYCFVKIDKLNLTSSLMINSSDGSSLVAGKISPISYRDAKKQEGVKDDISNKENIENDGSRREDEDVAVSDTPSNIVLIESTECISSEKKENNGERDVHETNKNLNANGTGLMNNTVDVSHDDEVDTISKEKETDNEDTKSERVHLINETSSESDKNLKDIKECNRNEIMDKKRKREVESSLVIDIKRRRIKKSGNHLSEDVEESSGSQTVEETKLSPSKQYLHSSLASNNSPSKIKSARAKLLQKSEEPSTSQKHLSGRAAHLVGLALTKNQENIISSVSAISNEIDQAGDILFTINTQGQEEGFPWVRPAPQSEALPSQTILKRKYSALEDTSETTPSKKSVTFVDPEVTKKFFYQKPEENESPPESKNTYRVVRTKGRKIYFEPKSSRRKHHKTSEEPKILWPSLKECTESVSDVIKELADSSDSIKALKSALSAKSITTIGHLCSLCEEDIKDWPIKTPKVVAFKCVMKAYENRMKKLNSKCKNIQHLHLEEAGSSAGHSQCSTQKDLKTQLSSMNQAEVVNLLKETFSQSDIDNIFKELTARSSKSVGVCTETSMHDVSTSTDESDFSYFKKYISEFFKKQKTSNSEKSQLVSEVLKVLSHHSDALCVLQELHNAFSVTNFENFSESESEVCNEMTECLKFIKFLCTRSALSQDNIYQFRKDLMNYYIEHLGVRDVLPEICKSASREVGSSVFIDVLLNLIKTQICGKEETATSFFQKLMTEDNVTLSIKHVASDKLIPCIVKQYGEKHFMDTVLNNSSVTFENIMESITEHISSTNTGEEDVMKTIFFKIIDSYSVEKKRSEVASAIFNALVQSMRNSE